MPDGFEFLLGAKVMPILTLHDRDHAAPLAIALSQGGVTVCEVTLRTPAALDAIASMRAAAPDLVVGAGTVRTPAQIDDVLRVGAQFIVTPGTTPALRDALRSCGAPALPGAATASEVMTLAEHGFFVQKFFPAEQAGGAAMLKAWQGPMSEISFCPTGGIGLANAPAYLALKTVACVGGSWLAPDALLAERRWDAITEIAAAAMAI
jgi:2-dehydro-3-deoxyphosphogluconate aldolase/(4S)-4-hydroxy-2-oxoglutarate aldolase